MEVVLTIIAAIFKFIGVIVVAWAILEVGMAADCIRTIFDPETFWTEVENHFNGKKEE